MSHGLVERCGIAGPRQRSRDPVVHFQVGQGAPASRSYDAPLQGSCGRLAWAMPTGDIGSAESETRDQEITMNKSYRNLVLLGAIFCCLNAPMGWAGSGRPPPRPTR